MSKEPKKPQDEGRSAIDFYYSGFRADPYTTYEYMRRFRPVCMVRPDDMWAISRAADVEYVLSNPQIFSSTGINLAYDSEWLSKKCRAPRLILAQDPPDHRKYRQIISDVFSRESVASLAPFMRVAAQSLLINFHGNTPIDFVQQFAYPYIGRIMRHLVGLNDSLTFKEIKQWVELEEQVSFRRPSNEFIKTYEKITLKQHKFYLDVFKARRKNPQDDLVTILVKAEVDNQKLSDKELYGIMSLIILAGFSTTVQMLNNGIILLSRRPELVAQLKNSPDLIPAFIEELLRFSPAGAGTLRITTESVVLANITIPKGEMVMAVLASANRDPHRFSNPDEFDLFRSNAKRHMTFGYGIHNCVGAALARLELKVAFEVLLQEFNAFSCPPHEDLVWEDSCFIHGVSELPVQFSNINIAVKEEV
jgi:cytochrome P450